MQESGENYLGAIYRLRTDAEIPLPLSELQAYFNFSRVSIHEMIRKLATKELVAYHPYHGVTLTDEGEAVAISLLRRHRLWERFLTDLLDVPWEDAHEIACRLEHAVTDEITERLADLLDDAEACPHGAPLQPGEPGEKGKRLRMREPGSECRIVRIAPETSELLHYLHAHQLSPASQFRVLQQKPESTQIEIDDVIVDLPAHVAEAIWTADIASASSA
jgi:DtxR family transcriptional regulator, Mn-dependent transcriptional regulator